MPVAINIQNVSKSFSSSGTTLLRQRLLANNKPAQRITALHNITLQIPRGEWLAVIGPNGSGKSTLLKLIAGIYQPDSGSITITGRIASSLDLGTGFHPELTAHENAIMNGLVLGLTRREIIRRLPHIIKFAELEKFQQLPLKHFSSGMRLRLGFAIAREIPSDIMLVDEALAVGDQAFRRRCLAVLRRRHRDGATIISVTHGPKQISSLADRAAYISNGKLQKTGAPAAIIATYQSEQQK